MYNVSSDHNDTGTQAITQPAWTGENVLAKGHMFMRYGSSNFPSSYPAPFVSEVGDTSWNIGYTTIGQRAYESFPNGSSSDSRVERLHVCSEGWSTFKNNAVGYKLNGAIVDRGLTPEHLTLLQGFGAQHGTIGTDRYGYSTYIITSSVYIVPIKEV